MKLFKLCIPYLPADVGDEEYHNNMWGHTRMPTLLRSTQTSMTSPDSIFASKGAFLCFLRSIMSSSFESYQEYVEIHSRCMRQLGLPVRPGNQLGQQSHGFWAKSGLCISFDPLDGSSNIIAAVSTGSIKAGYCMYWSSVIFVIMHGEFVLTQENIEIPRTGKIYSFKEENYRCTLEVWSEIFTGICCTVGFMGAAKSKNGMLKLFYECAPKSFMLNKVEENDHMVTREYYIQPTKGFRYIHQWVPLYNGSKEEVKMLEKYLARVMYQT
ncbi:unnamed protein product [Brassica oleracea var. botrytis]|uniref:(rape) hypothetical protein n=1 Tax=Brassica napus TaxID=3708 RepID=A0A816IH61_BRANA|nr:unnamed protein product [Brassica napus]